MWTLTLRKKVKLMKTIYFILLIFLMSPEALIHASNSDSNSVVVVVTPSDNDYSGDHIDDPEYPYRKPAMKMYCNISQESGITFSGSGIADEIVSSKSTTPPGRASQSSVTSSRSSTSSSPVSQANSRSASEQIALHILVISNSNFPHQMWSLNNLKHRYFQ